MNTQLDSIITGLPTAPRFQRDSASWNGDQALAAEPGKPHIETTNAGPALFIGRRTRNLLDPVFAPFAGVPESWTSVAGVSRGAAGDLVVNADLGAATLHLPQLELDPEREFLPEGSSFASVLYQFSAYARGNGTVTLKLRDSVHDLEDARSFVVTNERSRLCVALDGPLEQRTLTATIVVEYGTVNLSGLMLEPFIPNHRALNRSLRFPCPGGWVPGGQSRAADRLTTAIPFGSLPASGMIDFWFQPTWDALHPNHMFFEMAHWYFGFGAENQEPAFYAGERPCVWPHFWEWATAQGFAAGSWHHAAVTWNDDGVATLYWNGQPRAKVAPAQPHALNPCNASETLVIGAKNDVGMFFDPNVASELDGYLRSFRLTAGHITAEDVLVALESTRPVKTEEPLPDRAVFLEEGTRHEVTRAKDYCWFTHRLRDRDGVLTLSWAHRDDHGPTTNQRVLFDAEAHSHDRGRTWSTPNKVSDGPQEVPLPDGRTLYHPFRTGVLADGRAVYGGEIVTHEFPIRIASRDGSEEHITAKVDMAGYNGGRIVEALGPFLCLRDGSYMLLSYTRWPKQHASTFVLHSDDLRHWTCLGIPLEDKGLTSDGYCESWAAELPSGRLFMVSRTGGYNHALVKTWSDDRGVTWTPPEPTGMCGVLPILQVSDEGILFLSVGRPGIVIAASTDNGETFSVQQCAEDDRIHEFGNYFGSYGYSSMYQGLAVDSPALTAFLSYDIQGVRAPGDGTCYNACYVRTYPYRVFENYAGQVTRRIAPDDASIQREGQWKVAPGSLAVTATTGAALSGEFEGDSLVGQFEVSPGAGTAIVQIDDQPVARIALYYPFRNAQRKLLGTGLGAGLHRFRIWLEAGNDPEHKFANPEMPALGGIQTAYLSGTTAGRHLAIRGLEILNSD